MAEEAAEHALERYDKPWPSDKNRAVGSLASLFHEPGVGFAGRGVTGVGGGRRVAFGAAGRSRWAGRWAWRSASSGGAAQRARQAARPAGRTSGRGWSQLSSAAGGRPGG